MQENFEKFKLKNKNEENEKKNEFDHKYSILPLNSIISPS